MKRVRYLDNLRSKGTFADFYDPEAEKHPLPAYPYRWAPEGLLTMRQLRARGLRPGGQEIASCGATEAGSAASPTSTRRSRPSPGGRRLPPSARPSAKRSGPGARARAAAKSRGISFPIAGRMQPMRGRLESAPGMRPGRRETKRNRKTNGS